MRRRRSWLQVGNRSRTASITVYDTRYATEKSRISKSHRLSKDEHLLDQLVSSEIGQNLIPGRVDTFRSTIHIPL
jgi:hypothetical protein